MRLNEEVAALCMARRHAAALVLLRKLAHEPGREQDMELAAQIRRIENDWELETCFSIEAMAIEEEPGPQPI